MLSSITRCLYPDNRAFALLRLQGLTMRQIKQIQSHLTVSGGIFDAQVAAKLVAFCALSPHGNLTHADLILRLLPRPTIFLWTTMIRAYVERAQPLGALGFYKRMLSDGCCAPSNFTFSFVLRACLDLSSAVVGQQVHAHVVRLGWEFYDFVQNELIHMYAACDCFESARKLFDTSSHRDVICWTAMVCGYGKTGQLHKARELFDQMPERNAVAWSAMINNCAQFGSFTEALDLFQNMQFAGVSPNHAAVVGVLVACAHLGALDQGRWVHSFVRKNDMELDRILGTALIDMYAKCGCIDTAWQIFSEMPVRDVFAYTTMISGMSNHGHSEKALGLFYKMKDENVCPNEVTFICILSACSRNGLVDEGRKIFDSMHESYGILPGLQHYGCLVDLYGRAGLLKEAKNVLREMPMKPDSYVLGALLNACRVHGDVDLGKETLDTLTDFGITDSGVHVLLSNMYALTNRWQDVAVVRKEMELRNISKVPGCSLIEVDGGCFEFISGDHSYLLMEDLLLVLRLIDKHIKSYGLDTASDGDCCDFWPVSVVLQSNK